MPATVAYDHAPYCAKEATPVKRILRTPDASLYLGIARSTLEKARLTGTGPRFVRMGRSVGYDLADLDAWVESRKRASTSEPQPGGAS